MPELKNGLDVLGCFAGEGSCLSNGEVARLTGLSRSTSCRTLTLLTSAGFLVQTRECRYRLARSPERVRSRRGPRRRDNTA
jgi:DNA-binding IclR family transcriptional regulator